MIKLVTTTLISCVVLSAIGGFGAPLLCRQSADQEKCGDQWRVAAAGALTAAGSLGTLLARMADTDQR